MLAALPLGAVSFFLFTMNSFICANKKEREYGDKFSFAK
jgi:hypothetical protein